MNITKSVAAIATVLALAPSGAFAAALYGGGATAVQAAGVSVGASAKATATGAPSQSSQTGDASLDMGIGEPVTVGATADIKSDADLKAYDDTLMQADANIASADVSSDGAVTVGYYHPGKLFGIFPVKVKAETTASVDDSGSAKVETHMPWWNFFVTGTDDTRTWVDENLSGSSEVTTDVKMESDVSARARLIKAIVAAHAAASASAQAHN